MPISWPSPRRVGSKGGFHSGPVLYVPPPSPPSNWFVDLPVGITYNSITDVMEGTVMETTFDLTYLNVNNAGLHPVYFCANGTDFTAALNAAKTQALGAVIVLQDGITLTGKWTLPTKSYTTWTYIMSQKAYNHGYPGEPNFVLDGNRVLPADMTGMPIVQTANSECCLLTTNLASCSYYRCVGLNFRVSPTYTYVNYGIILVGNSSTSRVNMPHDIIFDRCAMSSHENMSDGCSRAIGYNGGATAVLGCRIEGIASIGDSQTIGGWGATGPLKVINCFLEATGENIIIGGSDPANLIVATDFEIRRNFFSKRNSWNPKDPSYSGKNWSNKNLLETKHGVRWLIEGNVFDGSFPDSQVGTAVLFKTSNQYGTPGWIPETGHVTMRYNRIRNFCSSLGFVDGEYGQLSYPNPSGWVDLHHVYVAHNEFDSGDKALFGQASEGRIILRTGDNFTLTHNTFSNGLNDTQVIQAQMILGCRDPVYNFEYTSNIFSRVSYGISSYGPCAGAQSAALARCPGYILTHNACNQTTWWDAAGWPVGSPARLTNKFQSNYAAIGFVDAPNKNFRISVSSVLHNAGHDGTDVGANIDKVDAFTAGVDAEGKVN